MNENKRWVFFRKSEEWRSMYENKFAVFLRKENKFAEKLIICIFLRSAKINSCGCLCFARRTLRINVTARVVYSRMRWVASTCLLYIFYKNREIAAMTGAKGTLVQTKVYLSLQVPFHGILVFVFFFLHRSPLPWRRLFESCPSTSLYSDDFKWLMYTARLAQQ